jgi:cytoskeletal protein CcmA (bactofilin family)
MAEKFGAIHVDNFVCTSGTDEVVVKVSGLTTIARSGITITGDYVGDNITASGDLTVSGTANISGLLSASGATIDNNLNVSGIYVQNDVTISGDLNVSGLITGTGTVSIDVNQANTVKINSTSTNLDHQILFTNALGTQTSGNVYSDSGGNITFNPASNLLTVEDLSVTATGTFGDIVSNEGLTLLDEDVANELIIANYANTTIDSEIIFRKARGSTGGPTQINAGDGLGTIYFEGHNGSTFTPGAVIECTSKTNTTNFDPDLKFYVDGFASNDHVATINYSGVVIESSKYLYFEDATDSEVVYIAFDGDSTNLQFGQERFNLRDSGNVVAKYETTSGGSAPGWYVLSGETFSQGGDFVGSGLRSDGDLIIQTSGGSSDVRITAGGSLTFDTYTTSGGALIFHGGNQGESYVFYKANSPFVSGVLDFQSLTGYRRFTFPDITGDFIVSAGTQSIGGSKTFTSPVQVPGIYMDDTSIFEDDPGTIKISYPLIGSGYLAYSIDERATFRANTDTLGLYDDTNDHWVLRYTKSGATDLYYNGDLKLSTDGTLSGIWDIGELNSTILNTDFIRSDALQLEVSRITQYQQGMIQIQRLNPTGETIYHGYAIDTGFDKRASFRANGSSVGLYDDYNSQWILRHFRGASTNLYYDGDLKLSTSSTGGTLSGTWDVGTLTVDEKIQLPNKEKGDLGSNGELSFDSSQGLILYRVAQGVTGAAVTVLDGANVEAGSNINITNLGAGDTGSGRITFSVDSTNLDADTLRAFRQGFTHHHLLDQMTMIPALARIQQLAVIGKLVKAVEL